MARDYHHAVLPVSCVDLDAAALGDILRQVLYEFPVRELDLALPRWVNRLENGHWLQAQVYTAAMQLAENIARMKDVPSGTDGPLLDCDAVQRSAVSGMDLAQGSVRAVSYTHLRGVAVSAFVLVAQPMDAHNGIVQAVDILLFQREPAAVEHIDLAPVQDFHTVDYAGRCV